MIPQTATVSGLAGEVVEQNFDYDLLTPGALAARSVGETVRLVRTNPVTGRVTDERAVVRAAPDGLVLDVGGHVEALDCAGLPERLVFERAPDGLADRPTLSVLVRSPEAGRRALKLSYLATGLAWSADYVLRLRPDGRSMDLTGWLTLANNGDTTFGNAPTQVVAGTLAREDVQRIEPNRIRSRARCWPRFSRQGAFLLPPPPPPPPPALAPPAEMRADLQEIVVTGSRIARQSELGDYKLYDLPEPTTVAARQVKQVRFVEVRAAPVEHVYEYRLDVEPDGGVRFPRILLRATNTKARGLGEPLPAGNVTIMEPGRARGLFFAGQDTVEDIPVGLPMEVKVGEATDIAVRQVLAEERTRGSRLRRAYEVTLTNAKAVAARLELRHEALGDLQVIREDMAHTSKDGAPLWTLTLRPGERRTFRYTVESDED